MPSVQRSLTIHAPLPRQGEAMKRRWLAPLAVLVFAVAALLASGDSAPPAAAQADPVAGKHICIDPGHGGDEPGAVNAAFKLVEREINLDESLYLRDQWVARGAIVTMTREGDETKSSRDRYELCNSVGADILVSVHTNSVSDSTIDGALSIYFWNEDKVLAGAVHEVLYPALEPMAPEPGNFDNLGLWKMALGVLLKSEMPSFTAEPVFMSHPAEAALLVTPIYEEDGGLNPDCSDCRRLQIAQAIIGGVDNYFLNFAGEEPEGPGAGKGRATKPR